MRICYYHVDAFSARAFAGNPAGVCLLKESLPDVVLQQIAAENNLSETAFVLPRDDIFDLRWFTPEVEVDLCGHATLASAAVLFSEVGQSADSVRFQTQSGLLGATRRGEIIELDFPSRPPVTCAAPEKLIRGLGQEPKEVLKARDYLVVYRSAAEVASLKPNMALLADLDCLGIIVTARDDQTDFVSRFFAPSVGVPEDPVTGSSHCSLIPFWAERLGKSELFARQISKRGGELFCRLLGERIGIGGRAAIYSRGELDI